MEKYLQPFPQFPRAISWTLKRPGLEMLVRGTTIYHGAANWRHLTVMIRPLGGDQPVDNLVACDVEDVRFFADRYFAEGSEVILRVPRPGEPASTIRLFSRLNEFSVLPDAGVVRRKVLADDSVFGVGDANRATEAPDLDAERGGPSEPAEGC